MLIVFCCARLTAFVLPPVGTKYALDGSVNSLIKSSTLVIITGLGSSHSTGRGLFNPNAAFIPQDIRPPSIGPPSVAAVIPCVSVFANPPASCCLAANAASPLVAPRESASKYAPIALPNAAAIPPPTPPPPPPFLPPPPPPFLPPAAAGLGSDQPY